MTIQWFYLRVKLLDAPIGSILSYLIYFFSLILIESFHVHLFLFSFSFFFSGVVEILVLLANNEKDFVVNEWCCYALYCLATHKSCSSSVVRDSILPCLIRLRKTPSERTRYFCMAALAFISQIPDVDSSQAIVTVVDMMKSEKNPG